MKRLYETLYDILCGLRREFGLMGPAALAVSIPIWLFFIYAVLKGWC